MDLTNEDMSGLFDAHAEDLLRYIARRTVDYQAAVDLVGETFAAAVQSRAKFRGQTLDEARPWLFGIARNLMNNFFRKGMVERRAMERLKFERAVVSEQDVIELEIFADTTELRRAIAIAMEDLKIEYREAVRLRVVEQRPYPEIAEVLTVTEEVARARVSRGLKRLRMQLDRLDPEGTGTLG